VARAADVLGSAPRLQPVLVGAIFGYRGRGSWAHTSERAAGEAEVERRAARYGLPPLVWPEGWPLNSLGAMRAAVWADRRGAGPAFARAVFEREFAHGEDISDVDLLEEAGRSVGLDGVREAIADPEIKAALREATEAAWERGVQGVPTLAAGRRLYFGDDRLEEAAAAIRGERSSSSLP
jgi:2-hydroxychromene-2-carboxylate isomerase